jgi:hypothetical protein
MADVCDIEIVRCAEHSSMARFVGGADALDIRGQVVVVPAVGIGHVGQRAIDLWAASSAAQADQSSAPLPLAGYLRCTSVRPFAGPSGIAPSRALLESLPGAAALEVYGRSSGKVVLVQQRGHCAAMAEERAARDIVEWALAGGAAALVVVGGCSAHAMEPEALDGSAVLAGFGEFSTPWIQEVLVRSSSSAGSGLAEGVRVLRSCVGWTKPAPRATAEASAREAPSGVGGLLDSWSLPSAAVDGELAESLGDALRGLEMTGMAPRYLRQGVDAGLPVACLLQPTASDSQGLEAAVSLALHGRGRLVDTELIGDAEGRLVAGPLEDAPQLATPVSWGSLRVVRAKAGGLLVLEE